MKKILRQNYNNQNLWCVDCKERIFLGQRYITIFETYMREEIEKHFHAIGCNIPEDEE